MTVLATVAACVAALAACVGLWFARGAVSAGRETVRLAAGARRADERARKRQRIEHLASLVEQVFHIAYHESGPITDCRPLLNTFPGLLVGLEDELPECVALAGLGQRQEIVRAAGRARLELKAP